MGSTKINYNFAVFDREYNVIQVSLKVGKKGFEFRMYLVKLVEKFEVGKINV